MWTLPQLKIVDLQANALVLLDVKAAARPLPCGGSGSSSGANTGTPSDAVTVAAPSCHSASEAATAATAAAAATPSKAALSRSLEVVQLKYNLLLHLPPEIVALPGEWVDVCYSAAGRL